MKYLVTAAFQVTDSSPEAAAEQVREMLSNSRLGVHFEVTPQSMDGEYYNDNKTPVAIPGRSSH